MIRLRVLYLVKEGSPSIKILHSEALFALLNDKFCKGKENVSQELYGELKPVKAEKTTEQLGYYHAVIIPYIQEGLKNIGYSGITKLDTHEFLKDRFYYKEILNETTGDYIKIGKSLADASIIEMSEYISRCINFASEYMNIPIPETK